MTTKIVDFVKKTVNGDALEVKASNSSIVVNFLQIQNQIKIFHWQTFSFAEHKAFDGIYDSLIDHVDKFLEVYMGKYGRPYSDSGFNFYCTNYGESDVLTIVSYYIDFLTNTLPTLLSDKDTDLLNIRDEMLGDFNQLKYL